MTHRSLHGARHDVLTVGALAAMAAVVVMFDHEALGHGSVCLAVGGQVSLLSTALFRCSAPSYLIDLGGPAMNLTLGLIALAASRRVPRRIPALRLALVLVAAFAGFWEGGYLVQAMATREGDLYFAGMAFIGEPSGWWRIGGGVLGVGLYLATWVVTARGVASIGEGRTVGRIAWLAATAAAVGAASLYRGGWGDNLLNTFLEIGLASLPLLFMPRSSVDDGAAIGRNRSIWVVVLLVLIVFAATQGRGIGDPGLAL